MSSLCKMFIYRLVTTNFFPTITSLLYYTTTGICNVSLFSFLFPLILVRALRYFCSECHRFTAARIFATGIGFLSFLRRRSLLTTYDMLAALARSTPIRSNARSLGPVSPFLSRYLRYLLYQLASCT